MKVLLVEENSALRGVIRQLVMAPGTWIQECVDITEALATYAAGRPDFVVMDVGTENLDGIAVSKQIKEMDPAARIVLVSDYDDAAMRESARYAGACGYVLKDNLLEVKSFLKSTTGDET
ncbi:MAG: response regulator transcription factor [Acidobacteriaceae bacterium]